MTLEMGFIIQIQESLSITIINFLEMQMMTNMNGLLRPVAKDGMRLWVIRLQKQLSNIVNVIELITSGAFLNCLLFESGDPTFMWCIFGAK
ncbi:hypothetical protein HOLleu_04724 [Holothuria leucospilota]|uniref:Uncharacterized protein n=1 Tax=Holothuria leucospilota TaxID=206669 RepID=A0A9Q1CJL6_HOLLE|nr:hypothetical protein HOLleu_04724 [Holothuria leucospilota]